MPQEKNPKGETHEHLSFFSYDKAAKKFMLRQFHIEGFVCQYAVESMSEDGRTFVFVSGPMENFMPGWRGRETYRFLNDNEFIETFALAGRARNSPPIPRRTFGASNTTLAPRLAGS